jgi:hypothetical protein
VLRVLDLDFGKVLINQQVTGKRQIYSNLDCRYDIRTMGGVDIFQLSLFTHGSKPPPIDVALGLPPMPSALLQTRTKRPGWVHGQG